MALNYWDLSDIKDEGRYRFSHVERITGISRSTLNLWRSEGKLVVFPDRPSMTRGLWLRYAVDGKPVPKTLMPA